MWGVKEEKKKNECQKKEWCVTLQKKRMMKSQVVVMQRECQKKVDLKWEMSLWMD